MNKLGVAGGLTLGAGHIIYTFFAKLWPVQTINFVMATRMMKPLPLARYLTVTPYSFFFGLIFNLIFGYIALAAIAAIYNALQNNK